MPDLTEASFDVMIAQTGLPLDKTQIATLREVYPMLAAMIERVTAPMPREAEPALIFQAESSGC